SHASARRVGAMASRIGSRSRRSMGQESTEIRFRLPATPAGLHSLSDDTTMSRLLLEICPERLASNGASVDLPPILICARGGQDALAFDGALGGKPVILRIQEN